MISNFRIIIQKNVSFIFCSSVLVGLCSCAASGQNVALQKQLAVYDVEIKNGESEKIISDLNRLNYENPDNPEIILRLANLNASLGRNNAAVQLYKKCLHRVPDTKDAWLGLVKIYLKLDAKEALLLLEKMKVLYPSDAEILNDYGVALDMSGKYQEAQSAYVTAISLDPTLVSAEVNLGLSMALSGQREKGLALIRPYAQAADATPRTREDYALVLISNGKVGDAQEVLSEYMSPSSVPAMLQKLTDFLKVHSAS
ncbi:tetratricopeptide repeat protein [Acetobacter fallax]|uniref:Tetratricopeptide repeat protein n=1 Tax=Acetobacter fallax TaxID=1737473 RepID=A0ABX0KGS5_9PROT|nr:tetratricopeptide repeat protein [Acetobacter fallax]NHO33630.1 tetratricopeptide repeat protein [Acetobacter fallax]NHO37217.1 tetratricopeptide repeat protein [Acetobacter fallax]